MKALHAPLVYPLPPVLPHNPYLDLLYGPMDHLAVVVRRDRPRTALPALLLGRGARILHLHFFDELLQRRSWAQTALRSIAMLGLMQALRARGVKLVWTAHNAIPHESYHQGWAARVYRAVARHSIVTIAHSGAARDELITRYHPRRMVVIPHGNYVGVYGPIQEREASRRALHLPPGVPVTLMIGSLRRYKNAEGLLDAFAALPETMRGVLLIAGEAHEASYADEVRRRAARIEGARVEARHIPDSELALYLGAADLVAVPYLRLLTSGALMLALSYARPVLAPAIGPVQELVSDGEQGILYTPGALADGLRRALHANLDAIGRTGFASIQRFNWGVIAQTTCEMYRDIA